MNNLEVMRILCGVPAAVLVPLSISAFSFNRILSTTIAFVYGIYVGVHLFPGWQFWLVVIAVPVFHWVFRVVSGVRHQNVGSSAWRATIDSMLKYLIFVGLMLVVILFGTLVAGGLDEVYLVVKVIFDSKTVIVLTGGLVAIFSGGVVIGLIVQSLNKSTGVSEVSIPRLIRVGAHVGRAERLLFFILITGGAPEAAALALTAKSLVRLPSISSDMDQAEYYLVGTLSSASVGLIVSIGTRLALGLPPL